MTKIKDPRNYAYNCSIFWNNKDDWFTFHDFFEKAEEVNNEKHDFGLILLLILNGTVKVGNVFEYVFNLNINTIKVADSEGEIFSFVDVFGKSEL